MGDCWKYREAIHCAYCGEQIIDTGYFETEEGLFVHEDCYDFWIAIKRKNLMMGEKLTDADCQVLDALERLEREEDES